MILNFSMSFNREELKKRFNAQRESVFTRVKVVDPTSQNKAGILQ